MFFERLGRSLLSPEYAIVGAALFFSAIAGNASIVPSNSQSQATTSVPTSLVSRLKDFSSEYVIVQVWSPFCEPCTKEVGELNSALSQIDQSSSLKGKVSALGIPVQSRRREIQAFVDYFKPQYAQWMPDQAFESDFLKNSAVPWTLLFGKNRQVLLKQWRGKLGAGDLVAAINEFEKSERGKL
jgi:thiol-disulfide isomerase/thioredoxin